MKIKNILNLKSIFLNLSLAAFSIFAFSVCAFKANAATEFVSVVDPGNGTGTDYTSLSAWETGVQTDLTSSATQVFAGVGTSAISDNATVYLCRGGSYQSHSGTVVHATSTQILVESITGSATEQANDVWYTNSSCNSSNYFTISDGGDSAIAVAKARTSTGAADTTAVTIDGWTTSATNYIKVWTDPSENYRHQGVWNESKYRISISSGNGITVQDKDVFLDGLQIEISGATGNQRCINHMSGGSSGNYQISNNILKGVNGAGYNVGIYSNSDASSITKIWNNLIYDIGKDNSVTVGIRLYYNASPVSTAYVYNNTVYNSTYGIQRSGNTLVAKNNISYNNTTDYSGTFDSSSTHNLSKDATAPAYGTYYRNANVVFADEENDDFHLDSSDIGARNQGTILYDSGDDSNLYFTTDIDGNARRDSAGTWDIGADENIAKIFRSVGAGATSPITTGSSNYHANHLSVSGVTATFEYPLPDNVGVGDAIQYDKDNDGDIDSSDGIAFIDKRFSSVSFRIKNSTGGTAPATTAADVDWGIYRSYISLSNAEAGTENTGIDSDLRSFDAGNRDIATNQEQWNFAAYANGTAADTTAMVISGWTTSPTSYIKVYTPTLINEVGTSQRHSGVWDDSKYHLNFTATANYQGGIYVYETYNNYLKIEGLQVSVSNGGYDESYGIYTGFNGSTGVQDVSLSQNIVKAGTLTSTGHVGIYVYGSGVYKISNNIVYDFTPSSSFGINSNIPTGTGSVYFYNNTAANNYRGISTGGYPDTVIGKNNLASGNSDKDLDAWYVSSTSTNNASSDTSASDGGSSYRTGQSFYFVDSTNKNFHLLPSDTGAKNYGADLSNDAYFTFNTDVDSAGCVSQSNVANNGSELCYTRPRGTTWDIGADEVITKIFRSVGVGATAPLATTTQGGNLTISGSTATFGNAPGDTIGVGDAIQYDDDNDGDIDSNDSIVFIHERLTSTTYTVKTSTGGVPTAVTNDQDWSIFRAYTSLANAESGTENTGIDSDLRSFDAGNRDIAANSEQWNFACYAGVGNLADGSSGEVAINGWTTSPTNYIRIYTPYLTSEVGTSQRHNGKWDDNKYKIERSVSGSDTYYVIRIYNNYTQLEGLQISGTSSGSASGINSVQIVSGVTGAKINSNIVKGSVSAGNSSGVMIISTNINYVWNNIIYGFRRSSSTSSGITTYASSVAKSYIYNNTVYDCTYGYYADGNSMSFKNNIAQNNTDGFGIFGAFNYSFSDYNLSDLSSDAPGSNSRNSTTVTFLDSTNDDFHLASSDTGAKDFGTDLSQDPIWQLMQTNADGTRTSMDIDGASRPLSGSGTNWDIGADEAATEIFRSVGPNATGNLTESSGNSLSISGFTGTFATAPGDSIGVGDVIQYDSDNNGTVDALAFISGRTSSTVYTVKSAVGGSPVPTVSNDTDWTIFRAYASLYDAERGNENSGFSDTLENFDDWTTGGGRDDDETGKNLTTYNEQWNIAAYANGTTADGTAVTITGWDTGAQNYLKIYTPTVATEAGTSQRHSGKWDYGKYNLSVSGTSSVSFFSINEEYIKIDGLQIFGTINSSGQNYPVVLDITTNNQNSDIQISNNIIKADFNLLTGSGYGVAISAGGWSGQTVNTKIWNNIIYDIKSPNVSHSTAINYISGTSYIYNNTIYNSGIGIGNGGGGVSVINAKNNIVQNCYDGYIGASFTASSDFNISDLASDAPSPSYRNNLATNVSFVDAANDDFHLSSSDTAARNAGANLTSDVYLSITSDVDGHSRTGAFDIGADEGATAIFYSVGQSTAPDLKRTANVTVSGYTATFDAAQTGNIGVGDKVTYTGGSCYISGKTSQTVWSCQSATGGTAPQVSGVSVTSINRAFGSLSSAEAGAPTLLGTSDLATNNYQLNLPCYYDSGPDTTAVTVDGYTTSQPNYIRIYAPYDTTNEVNQRQRHWGKWDEGKYRIETTTNSIVILLLSNYTRLDGIQIKYPTVASYNGTINIRSFDSIISNNIINAAGSNPNQYGIVTNYPARNVSIYNNIIYGFSNTTSGKAIFNVNSDYIYFYNNTIFDCYNGIYNNSGYVFAKNNLYHSNNIVGADGFYGSFLSSDYNISDLTSDAPSPSYRNNLAIDVIFADETNKDFHLGLTDTMARNAGTSLANDSAFAFSTDIDGNGRGQWDIGADEGSVEMNATVMQTGGDYSSLSSWETGMQTNLVTNTTMLYGGTATSSISDNASLYLCRSGVFQNVTGTAVHFRSNQALVELISSPAFPATGDIWYTNNTCNSSNYFTLSDAGNPAIAVAKIDGAWTTADTNAVTIDGWTTSAANYIKVWTDPSENYRHHGKWDDDKYRLEISTNNYPLNIIEEHVQLSGVQVKLSLGSHSNYFAIRVDPANNSEILISDNIVKGEFSGSVTGESGIGATGNSNQITKIYNNIVFGFSINNSGNGIYVSQGTAYVYNNTSINNFRGINRNTGTVIAKNNLAYNNSDNYFGSFSASSTNNLSGPTQTDAPGSNPQNAKAVVFVDEENDDFHLAQADTNAKNAGANLTSDVYLPITSDVDSQTRNASTSAFDIGADETATQVFFSVGQNTSDHKTGSPTVTISGGVGTFSVAQTASNMGVGDAVTYNTNVVAYISEKISDSKWKLITTTGGTPADISGSTVVSIAHAFSSLSSAESGIPTLLGTSDLVANNYQLNIPCYYDTGADTASVTMDGWTTSSQNYIKIYTPNNTVTEVNQSQRHSGVWMSNRYHLSVGNASGIYVITPNLVFDGLQVEISPGRDDRIGIGNFGPGTGNITIKNCIIRNLGAAHDSSGITFQDMSNTGKTFVFNNIVYGNFYTGIMVRGYSSISRATAYNNTVVTTGNRGIWGRSDYVHVKNNVSIGATTPYYEHDPFLEKTNNASGSGDPPGSNGVNLSSYSLEQIFVDPTNRDYRLVADGPLVDVGADLSKDNYLSFDTDISGNSRSSVWDIGASEFIRQTIVASEKQQEENLTDGLVLYQSFNGDDINGTTAIDRSGNGNDGTITGATKVIGKRGQALSFDGDDDQIEIPDSNNSLDGVGQVTLSLWFYPTSSNGNYKIIAGKGVNAANYGLWYQGSSFVATFYNGSWRNHNASGTYATGEWYHLSMVIDNNNDTVRIYVNGVDRTVSSAETSDMVADNGSFYVTPSYSGRPAGKIDEVRVYNRALSSDEIGSLYRLGENKINVSQATNIDDGLVLSQSFDGKYITGSTAIDASGNGNSGTIYGATPTIGKRGQALSFDGDNDYVNFGNDLNSQSFTISSWIKPKTVSGLKVILGKLRVYELNINYLDNQKTLCIVGDGSFWQSSPYSLSSSNYNIDEWNHVACVFDGTNLTTYQNGIEGVTVQPNRVPPINNSNAVLLSRSGSGTGWDFYGSVDEVRFYNRALSADEVGDLYRMGQVEILK